MGLNFYFADQSDDAPDGDPHGLRMLLFETLRELSDVAHTQAFGMNGHAQVRVRFPDDEMRRLSDSIRENLPAERMNDFFKEIDAHARGVRKKLECVNGSLNIVDKNIYIISLRLNDTVHALLTAAATGNDPVVVQDDFTTDEHDQAMQCITDELLEADEWDNWDEKHPEDAIVEEEGMDDENDPFKESIHHWRPEEEEEDQWGDAHGLTSAENSGLFLSTPSPEEIDHETEDLILAEAQETSVDMNMIINAYLQLQDHLEQIAQENGTLERRDEYHEIVVAIMLHIANDNDGKTNLECLALQLSSPVVLKLMTDLTEEERVECVNDVFHNVAEAALMLVESYSDMVNACSIGDDEEYEASIKLTLTFIERLRERLGLS